MEIEYDGRFARDLRRVRNQQIESAMTANLDREEPNTTIKDYEKALSPGTDPAKVHFDRAIAWLRLSEWDKAQVDLVTASSMGADIIALFHAEHRSIAAFEKKANVKLPREIIKMLASDKGEKLRAAAGGWVGLVDGEELKRVLYQARIDGSRKALPTSF